MKRMTLFFFLLLSLLQMSKAGNEVTDIYKQFDRLQSKRLYNDAYQYIMSGNNDKALVCYSIIIGRMNTADTSTVRLSVGAMGNSAYVYSVHEFGKSFLYLDKAIKTAEQYGISDKLPFLYLNMANLLRANETVRTPYHLSSTVIGYYRKSFLSAKEMKDWNVLLIAFNNVVSIAIGCKQVADIRFFLNEFDKLSIPRQTPGLFFSQLHYRTVKELLRNDSQAAQRALDMMLRQPECGKDIRIKLMVLSDKAAISYYDHNYNQCTKIAQQAIELAISHNERDVAVSFYDFLSK